MNSEFKITSENVTGTVPVTVFHLSGWLDAQSENELLNAANKAHENGSRYLLIDMSALDTLTSAGMRALQKVYKVYTPNDNESGAARVKLCSAPPSIYHILSMTGFLQSFPMYESLDDAVESFSSE